MSSANHKHWFSNLILKMYNLPIRVQLSWCVLVGGMYRAVSVVLDFPGAVSIFHFDDTHRILKELVAKGQGTFI